MKEEQIQAKYDKLLRYVSAEEADADLLEQVREWQTGKWKSYLNYVIGRIPVALSGKTIVDFGCRYGLIFPLLFEMGARRAIGIEDLDLFLTPARELFRDAENVEFLKSEQGYIPLQPETAELMILNEVISHIHPTYLPTVYSEAARILVAGGMLFISDGNNLGNATYTQDRLLPLYQALENGPDGTRVGDVVVQVCFLNQRKQIVRARCPDMEPEKIEYLAQNTSGLFGSYLHQVIDRFARTGELVRRPYRTGIAPVYPDSGQVEEAGFYPESIALDLMRYGFDCEILNRPSRAPSTGRRIPLDPAQMKPSGHGRFAYQIPMPQDYPESVAALLLEDAQVLPIPTDDHASIGREGSGRYSMWKTNRTIYFSSTDGSDPRRNGRKYALYWTDLTDDCIAYPSPNFQITAKKKA